ncbi:hypothetical protein TCAL_10206 [Tigriopus californicus]|uniref:RNA 3'-terminal phosphate cyclase n=1 Tax=Tigriopus californicus TaxID=6832 RepID=A0A553PH29_TIGCA|nr:RNA 3'-terminal phosphate cyclase-like [Tigriopus californicus]TRY76993.1 hypothetical protein TCAL_10206 [Tigriopus californicus]|eukprot:TCALIF_10206-PA protein Name:"Similar to RTCA RNA 3'-terminal phosphate cyclase (Bos taurus)" AED:0.01 eAED:0.01 QI:0/-1/0/1/-1/1/1/0/363
MATKIQINGTHLEGGGQILRMAVGFASILGTPIHIHSIRGNRSKPGLKAQHLKGIELSHEIRSGQLSGNTMHSMEVDFIPEKLGPKGGQYSADTRTAGAVTLLAQVSLPVLLFADAPSTLDLKGGTNADMAPTVEYYDKVFRPNLALFGAQFDLTVKKKGYFPKGGGHVELTVAHPVRELSPVDLTDPGKVESIEIEASVAGTLPESLAQSMTRAAEVLIKQNLPSDCRVLTRSFKEASATANGSSIVIVAKTSTGCTIGACAVGSPKVNPKKTGENAAHEVLNSLRQAICVDKDMQNMLIIYMALAKGQSRILTGPLEMHTTTAIWISELLSHARFQVHKRDDKTNIIECQGIGWSNQCPSE